MRRIIIENKNDCSIIEYFQKYLGGAITINNGEEVLEFDNENGQGSIRNIVYDWGISLLDYHVYFKEDIEILFQIKKVAPIEFLYVSNGNLKYAYKDHGTYVELERFQNVIISNKCNSENLFLFPANKNIHLNTIQLVFEKFKHKRNNNLDSLHENLLSVVSTNSNIRPFRHFGNYDLKIAKEINDLNKAYGTGIVKSLSIEGHLNLILALQILEHKNFIENESMPDSLSQMDIKKIHDVAHFIIDNVANYMSIKTLSREFGITPKKLQTGFKLLYSKSVNEYVRQIKLEIARDLIKNSEQSISEIVYNIGYKSRSYFSKIFYEKYSILPTEYRDRLRNADKPRTE